MRLLHAKTRRWPPDIASSQASAKHGQPVCIDNYQITDTVVIISEVGVRTSGRLLGLPLDHNLNQWFIKQPLIVNLTAGGL